MAYVLPHLLFLLLLLIPVSTSAQNVTLGSSLSIHDEKPFWTSPSGEFAFGFHPIAGDKAFLLAIWFHKIPSKTIVWTANKEDKAVQGGSKVEVTDAGIILNDDQGNEIWSGRPKDNSRASSAAMLNTGNFVLRSDPSTFIWESFENPTDTILPTQILNQGNKLSSRLTEEDYLAGRFELRLQADGNLVSYTIARPTDDAYVSYWESNTKGSNSKLIFNQSGYIYLDLRNGRVFDLTKSSPVSVKDFYHKATLDFDGVFRQYTYPKTSSGDGRWPQSWSVVLSLPENICLAIIGDYGSGACGYNSYCKLGQEQRPECECPPGYIHLDPKNTFKGCRQNFTQQSCVDGLGAAGGFRMEEIPNTDWPLSDFEWFKVVNEDFCSETCLNDCFCAASIIRDGSCWKKKFPLSNGKMDPSVGGKALIKMGSS